MGAPDNIELQSVSELESVATFCTLEDDRCIRELMLCLTAIEVRLFREVLALRPFAATKAHRVWLRFLKRAPEPICGLRIAANGSRKEIEIPVSVETFAGLEYVFHQFSLDPELVPERPACVLQAPPMSNVRSLTDKSRVYVDFNEMPTANEVLLSKSDTKIDSTGRTIHFVEGMPLSVYMDDQDEHGSPDNLVAEGIARRNHHGGWTATARWLLVISERGIRHESAERPHELPEV